MTEKEQIISEVKRMREIAREIEKRKDDRTLKEYYAGKVSALNDLLDYLNP